MTVLHYNISYSSLTLFMFAGKMFSKHFISVIFTAYIAPFLYCMSKLGLYLAYRADLLKSVN